jgi:hypothetical protein
VRPEAAEQLGTIAGFLARRDVPSLDRGPTGQAFDVLVLCGSAVLQSLDLAAGAFHDGVVGDLLVTGGIGHSTAYLYEAVRAHPTFSDVATGSRTEAAVLAEILQRHLDVPGSAIVTEQEATNCGENAALSLRTLARRGGVSSVLLVQDPTMQRRTHAGFDRHQETTGSALEVVSYAPFVPVVTARGAGPGGPDGRPVWTLDRFVSLALGEVRRLVDDGHGYGPRGRGFIGHVDVPPDVVEGYRRLRASVPVAIADR